MKIHNTAALTLSLLLSACGGGGGSSPANGTNTGSNTNGGSAVVVQQGCTNKFGRNWTAVDRAKQNLDYFHKVVYGGGLFLGSGYNATASSQDGANWVNLPKGTLSTYAMNYAQGKFIMVGTTQVASSTDGSYWNFSSMGGSATVPVIEEPFDMSYGNGRIVVVGLNNTIIWSTDAKNWNLATNRAGINAYRFDWSAFANGKFFTSALDKPNELYVSSDGNTWQIQHITGDGVFPTGQVTGLQYFNNLYVAVDVNGAIATSSDSINWKTAYKGVHSHLFHGNQIAAGNGQLMTVSYGYDGSRAVGNDILYSCDGLNWEKTHVPNHGNTYSIAIGDNAAVATDNVSVLFSNN